jgi:ornithine carbamoyltransferase
MADLMAIREKFGEDLKGKKFVLSWAYSSYFGGYTGSECHTNIALMTRFGMDVTLAYPKGFEVQQQMIDVAKKNAEDADVNFEIANSMKEAAEDADVIYPVNWLPYSLLQGTENDLERRKKIIMENTEKNRDWICSDDVMKAAHRKAVYMHCMPFARGEEVTASVADGPQSIIIHEAENRLHVQKAILALVIGGL